MQRVIFSLLVILFFFIALEGIGFFLELPPKHDPLPLDTDLGWRMEKPSHTFSSTGKKSQILLLGDSITYNQLDQGDSFSQRLYQKYKYPVLNLSGIGYGTDQELILLKLFYKRLPNVRKVILNFCIFNDFGNNINRKSKPYFSLKTGRLVLHKDHIQYSGFYYLLDFIQKHSFTYFLLREVLDRMGLISKNPYTLNRRFDEPPVSPTVWEYNKKYFDAGKSITRALILEMNDFVRNKMKDDFLVIVHPMALDPDKGNPYLLQPREKKFFKNLHVPVFDMGCFYKAQNLDYRKVLGDRHGHLFYLGEEAVTFWIHSYLQKMPRNPECFL